MYCCIVMKKPMILWMEYNLCALNPPYEPLISSENSPKWIIFLISLHLMSSLYSSFHTLQWVSSLIYVHHFVACHEDMLRRWFRKNNIATTNTASINYVTTFVVPFQSPDFYLYTLQKYNKIETKYVQNSWPGGVIEPNASLSQF